MTPGAIRRFLAAAGLGPGVAAAQVGDFHFQADRVPVGRVHHYLKSNRDGSRPAHITLYVASTDRLEALKWDSGGEHATLVVARMDWSRFSVRRLESWSCGEGAGYAPREFGDRSARKRYPHLVLSGFPDPDRKLALAQLRF